MTGGWERPLWRGDIWAETCRRQSVRCGGREAVQGWEEVPRPLKGGTGVTGRGQHGTVGPRTREAGHSQWRVGTYSNHLWEILSRPVTKSDSQRLKDHFGCVGEWTTENKDRGGRLIRKRSDKRWWGFALARNGEVTRFSVQKHVWHKLLGLKEVSKRLIQLSLEMSKLFNKLFPFSTWTTPPN